MGYGIQIRDAGYEIWGANSRVREFMRCCEGMPILSNSRTRELTPDYRLPTIDSITTPPRSLEI